MLLVEDHLALCKGLELLLAVSDMELAGVAATAARGISLFVARRPTVTVVDLSLDAASGLSAMEGIRAADPDAAVLFYVGPDDHGVLEAAAACGTRGFVMKTGGSDELVAGIRALADGGVYVDPAVATLLAGSVASDVLTDREREILQLLARGLTGERVAELLFLSPETVRTHIRNAMRRLDARTRVHAVTLALSLGEISQAPPSPG